MQMFTFNMEEVYDCKDITNYDSFRFILKDDAIEVCYNLPVTDINHYYISNSEFPFIIYNKGIKYKYIISCKEDSISVLINYIVNKLFKSYGRLNYNKSITSFKIQNGYYLSVLELDAYTVCSPHEKITEDISKIIY